MSVLTLYHATSPDVAILITFGGFKSGDRGAFGTCMDSCVCVATCSCRLAVQTISKPAQHPSPSLWLGPRACPCMCAGAGIYFATTPEATRRKATAGRPDGRLILECRVDLGRCKVLAGPSPRLTLAELRRDGFDSAMCDYFPSGREYIIFEAERVLSKRILHREGHATKEARAAGIAAFLSLDPAKLVSGRGPTTFDGRPSYGDVDVCPHCRCETVYVPMDPRQPTATCGDCDKEIRRPKVS